MPYNSCIRSWGWFSACRDRLSRIPHMSVFTAGERTWVDLIERIDYCNPFVPERIAGEREALGDDFDERCADWNRKPEVQQSPNIRRLAECCEKLLRTVRDRGSLRRSLAARDRARIDALLLFALFQRFHTWVLAGNPARPATKPGSFAALYGDLAGQVREFLPAGDMQAAVLEDLPHIFACFFQLHRAFDNI